jgi:diguanylate cyclase (GGDEF)-like protein
MILYHLRVHGFLYFIPMPFKIYEACVWIGLSGFGIFMTLFAKQFMSLKQRLPVVNGLLNLGIVVFFIQAAVGVFISSFWANEIAYITGLIIPILIMGTVLYLFMKGYKELRFYLLAWCALFTATVIWATMPYAETFFSPNLLFVMGTSLDSILFTFSIFDMIRSGLREKEEMQAREKYYIALSRTDSLTGLYNRRYLTEIVKQLEQDKELPPESALIMVDLDNFKQINDTYGHLSGDIILARVGSIIKKHIRKTDIACRYGGDEFLVFLLGAKLESAQSIGEQIRKEILAEENYSETGEEIIATISLGITETRLDDTFDGMFLRADAALYQAKKLGRNRLAVL